MNHTQGTKINNNTEISRYSPDSFKRKLKFYLFDSCFNVWCVLL